MTDSQRWERICETHLQKAKRLAHDRLEALCPVHEDTRPSLTVNLRTGWADCHAGSCSFKSGTLEALFEAAGLPTEGTQMTKKHREPEACYVYRTAIGENYQQVLRLPGKEFRQQRWTGSTWEWKAPQKTLPYRLDQLAKAKASEPVVWVEGEKDADRAAALKLLATTSPGGVEAFGKLDLSSLSVLEGRRVLMLPDNDLSGRRYTLRVAKAVERAGGEPRILDLAHHWPGSVAPVKADLSKWLDAGGTKKTFLELARAAFETSLDLVAWQELVKLEEFLEGHKEQLEHSPPEPWEADPRAKRWALPACPWDRSHTWTAQVLWLPSGQVQASCSCCPSKEWVDLTPALERGAQESEDDGWQEPTSLDALPSAEAFPLEALPDWQRDFVTAVALFTQTPPCLGALMGLSVLAAAAGKKFQIEIREGWAECLNLFTLTALRPAERKSWVVREITAPLRAFEKTLVARAKNENRERRLKREMIEAELKEAKNSQSEAERLIELQDRKAAQADLPLPRLLVDDATSEVLPGILAANQGCVAVLDAEGTFLSVLAGRYSKGDAVPALEVVLKGYDGESIRVDRVAVERLPVFVEKPILTIGLAVQPDVVVRCAEKPAVRERGLLGRFILAIPQGKVGSREIEPPTVAAGLRERYHDAVTRILAVEVPAEEGEPVPVTIRLQVAARVRLMKFMAELEPRLGEDGDLGQMTDWAGKLVGKVARMAALLHVAEHFEDAKENEYISEETMERAIRIGIYSISQAKRTYSLLGYQLKTASPAMARKLWEKIHQLGLVEFSRRSLHVKLQDTRGFEKAADLDAPLAYLTQRGYLRSAERAQTDRPRKGRPPSPHFEVNPKAPPPENPRQKRHNSENGVKPRVAASDEKPTIPRQNPDNNQGLFDQVAGLL